MATETGSVYSRKNPFPAPLAANRKLTLESSEKDTRHFELSLAGSGVKYEVGDSLGVFAKNDPELAEQIIHALHATGDEMVAGVDGGQKPLREALLHDYQITQPSKQFIRFLAENGGEALRCSATCLIRCAKAISSNTSGAWNTSTSWSRIRRSRFRPRSS